jgi:ABC-type hemin transport system substrate-binding protein
MGPAADISDMSSATTNNQTLSLPKLKSDSSNWATYSERVLNYLTSKGLRRHVQGTARKPETLTERGGSYYKTGSLAPLNDEELEKHEDVIITISHLSLSFICLYLLSLMRYTHHYLSLCTHSRIQPRVRI